MPSTDQNPARVMVVMRNMVDEMKKAQLQSITVKDLENALNIVELRMR